MPAVHDSNEEAQIGERQWGSAIHQWQAGKPERVLAAIMTLPIPDFARDFLKDVATGKARRRMGAPPKWPEPLKRSLVRRVFTEWKRLEEADAMGSPQDEAIALVASGFTEAHPEGPELSSDGLRAIVE